jgi:hypothetical protein
MPKQARWSFVCVPWELEASQPHLAAVGRRDALLGTEETHGRMEAVRRQAEVSIHVVRSWTTKIWVTGLAMLVLAPRTGAVLMLS